MRVYFWEPLLAVAIFCKICAGDIYKRRFEVMEEKLEELVVRTNGKSLLVQGLATAYETANPVYASGFEADEITAFQDILKFTDILAQKSYYTSNREGLRLLMSGLYSDLNFMTPKIYEAIRYTNITTWGPIEAIFYITLKDSVEKTWDFIKTVNPVTGRCLAVEAYANFDERFKNEYLPDPAIVDALCTVSPETPYIWIQLMQLPEDYPVYYLNDSSQFFLHEFWRVLKTSAYQVNDAYFKHASEVQDLEFPPITTESYGIVNSLQAVLQRSDYTITQKGFIKQVASYYLSKFPLVSTPEERQTIVSEKFSQNIDLSYGYFERFARIPVLSVPDRDWLTYTFYDIIMYTCVKDFFLTKLNEAL